jgi:glucose-1-phosphate cytidylyltransferase
MGSNSLTIHKFTNSQINYFFFPQLKYTFPNSSTDSPNCSIIRTIMEAIPVVILCGGQGTRMRGQTVTKKELVQVGGQPIIWHVMRIFSAYGHNRFILTLGYQAEQMKRYFIEYNMMARDFSISLGDGQDSQPTPRFLSDIDHPTWEVILADTGLLTEKASRIARVSQHIDAGRFFVAYGDDVSDVDLGELAAFHRQHGKLATITAVQITLPYGIVEADETGLVTGFIERPQLGQWINGGFMLFERPVLERMADGPNVNLETDILPQLARQGELMIYRHSGFWQSMNTIKDNILLEKLWQEEAPWKVW